MPVVKNKCALLACCDEIFGGKRMKTFMANAQTIERKWYVLDAADVSLGHTAAKAAAILLFRILWIS